MPPIRCFLPWPAARPSAPLRDAPSGENPGRESVAKHCEDVWLYFRLFQISCPSETQLGLAGFASYCSLFFSFAHLARLALRAISHLCSGVSFWASALPPFRLVTTAVMPSGLPAARRSASFASPAKSRSQTFVTISACLLLPLVVTHPPAVLVTLAVLRGVWLFGCWFLPSQQPVNGFAAFPTDPQQDLRSDFPLAPLRGREIALGHADPLCKLSLGRVEAS